MKKIIHSIPLLTDVSQFRLNRVILIIAFALSINKGIASEWQWSVPIKGAIENAGLSRAFLWIPPNCKKLRGVIVAQHNMEEIMILENPGFRKAMSELGIAEIWCAPSFDHLFRFNQGAGEVFNNMMKDLANESGYTELNNIPIVPIGHSAAASWPYYFAAWNPERTLAAISVSGQWPYFRNPSFAPDIWGDKNIDFVPSLETMGEYESAKSWSTEGLKERQQHSLMPLSMLACPGEGHFSSSDKKAAYIALYIKKALQYRMPKDVSDVGPVRLIPIDPSQTGWLVEKWIPNQTPSVTPAPVNQFKGDLAQAFWFFDEEHAKATEVYEAAYRGYKPQLVGYQQDGKMVPQSNTHLQVNLKFQPLDDRISFKLTGAFYDTIPGGSPRLPDWAGLPVGSPIGHASGNIPVTIDRICGPFEKLGPDKFVLSFDRATEINKPTAELVFAAMHPGDNEYKQAIQQASMMVRTRNTEGTLQIITFPHLTDQKMKTKSVKLNAISDAGLQVYYYVRQGPAEVEGNMLRFTQIPPRSKFPIKVTVVAWQYGRGQDPKIKTAEQVQQSFMIVK